MRILLIGYGKMGKALEAFILQKTTHTIIDKIKSEEEFKKFSYQKNIDVDFAIEFTTPLSAFDNIRCCLKLGIPVISGTTGWIARKPQIELLCKGLNGTFFFASNFSLAINSYLQACAHMSWLLDINSHFDVSITETHHKEKKDIPSGTSVTIAETIIKNCNAKSKWTVDFLQDSESIHIDSKREAETFGVHTTLFKNESEEIAITHKAFSREVFVSGVLTVAEWIFNSKKSGILSMNDFAKSFENSQRTRCT